MSDNPYSPPESDTDNSDAQDYGEVKVFGVSGRLGRVRYIGYTMGFTLLFGLVFGLVAGTAGFMGSTPESAAGAMGFAGLLFIPLLVLLVMLSIQRLHDFNLNGWWVILYIVLWFIPLISLIAHLAMWIIPGTDGGNNYGKKTPPNNTLAIIFALILPVVVIAGILAAIAIPAYQDYVERARVEQQSNQ